MALEDLDSAGKHTSVRRPSTDRPTQVDAVDDVANAAGSVREDRAAPPRSQPATMPIGASAILPNGARAGPPTAESPKHAKAVPQHRPRPPKPPKDEDRVKGDSHGKPGPHGRDADQACP